MIRSFFRVCLSFLSISSLSPSFAKSASLRYSHFTLRFQQEMIYRTPHLFVCRISISNRSWRLNNSAVVKISIWKLCGQVDMRNENMNDAIDECIMIDVYIISLVFVSFECETLKKTVFNRQIFTHFRKKSTLHVSWAAQLFQRFAR